VSRGFMRFAIGVGRLAMAGTLALAVLAAAAQTPAAYPSKPIRVVVPLAAGSAVDNAARVVLQKMAANMGQPIYVENIPGASGLIGAEQVARAPKDGYTLGGFNDSVLTMIPHILPKMTWNALTDFEPISLVATVEWALLVRPDAPYRTTADFIAAVKAAPGKMNYGSGGNGSPQHIAMALFAARAGLDMVHVPYKGATPAAMALASGDVDADFQGLGTVTSLVAAGKLRMLGVATPQRLAQYPNVPTIDESGLSGFSFNSWFALVAPAGTLKPVVDRLHAEVLRALADPATRDQLVQLGMTLRGTSPAELGAGVRSQYALYGKLIREHNIKAD
jgi:tripartite-type tricarboxylate transporter receptor subunit TctC